MPSSVVQPRSSSVVQTLFGTLRRPRQTFAALAARPAWTGALLVTFAIIGAAKVGLMLTPEGQQALTDQWATRAEAFGQPVTDANYQAFVNLGSRAVEIAAATAIGTGLVLAVAVALLAHLLFRGRTGATLSQALAVTTHAGAALALRELVAAPLNFVRESLSSPLTLGTLFQGLDEVSAAARFLGMIDLFWVWWLALLAFGFSAVYGRRAGRLAAGFIGLYVAFGLVMAGAMAVLGGQL